MPPLKVLLTGPFGRVGPTLAEAFRSVYDLRTFDRLPETNAVHREAHIIGDLGDKAALLQAMAGREAVVHLAAVSDEAPFVQELVPHNIVGVYNVLEAAVQSGVRRVVFASTCATVGVRRKEEKVEPRDPPRPHKLYGVSKVFGETLGRYYHDKHGLEFIALRLGGFGSYKEGEAAREGYGDLWLSPRDCASLFRRALETPSVGFAVVNGTSRTIFEHLSLRPAREILGWEPEDDGHPLL